MIYSIGRQERTFQVRHFKACPVAVLDGATAFGGGNLLIPVEKIHGGFAVCEQPSIRIFVPRSDPDIHWIVHPPLRFPLDQDFSNAWFYVSSHEVSPDSFTHFPAFAGW
jgi:hypothetical protein